MTRFYSVGSNRLLSCFIAVIILMLGLSACTPKELPPDSLNNLSALPEDAGEWVTVCGQYPELCVPICQRSAELCATQLNDFVTSKQPDGKYLFQTWPLFNNNGVLHANTGTPMHGAYLAIYANDVAHQYMSTVLQHGKAGSLDLVDLPNGSLIVKQNFVKKTDSPQAKDPWLTVMWKLDGYCHGNFGGSGPCTGGEWFYYLSRFDSFHDFNGQPSYGKAQSFCADCHGPVQKADFLWSLYSQLKAQQLATAIVPSEKAATQNVVNFCLNTPIDSTVPGDVAQDPSKLSPKEAQQMFNCLSWRSFVALNWPADAGNRGKPDNNKNLSDTNSPRVWESYREIFEIFQPANPNWKLDNVSWNSQEHLDPVCDAEKGTKVLRMASKNRASPVLNETHQAFGNQFNILVDQNGNQLHYEVLINRDEFLFFKDNKYANTGNYDVGGPYGQLSWQALPLHFPDNIRGEEGAIEIKAAWRIMCSDASCSTQDDPEQYYTRNVQIYEPLADGGANCNNATVGLVGMHIGHKTYWTPQWVWSTFEHLNNVPSAGQDGKKGKQYGLWGANSKANQPNNAVCLQQRPGALPGSPDAKVINCPNNQLICNSPPSSSGVAPQGNCAQQLAQSKKQNNKAAQLIPNQVTRIDPISTTSLNATYPDALAAIGGPWSNYRLVNTQWAMDGRGTPIETTINMRLCGSGVTKPCYKLAPPNLRLRNTTMETFQVSYIDSAGHLDPDGQNSSVGCMQCHGVAGLDFSFAWSDAAEEVVLIVQDQLSDPPAGSYRQSCSDIVMNGATLGANCLNNDGIKVNSPALRNAHLCATDIANINGRLWCNPPVGSYELTCSGVDLQSGNLTANCQTDAGIMIASTLALQGYQGIIENCDGVLTKGRC